MLARAAGTFFRWFDRLIPPEIRDGDPEARRLARLVLLFTLVIDAPGPVFNVLHFMEGKVVLALVASLTNLAFLGVIPVLWFTRSITASANYILANFYLLILGVICASGGLSSDALYVLTAVPLVGMLAGGVRWGGVWLGLVFVVPSTLGVLQLGGVEFPVSETPEQLLITSMLGSFAQYGMMFGIVLVFERGQRRAYGEMKAREDDIRRILDHIGQGFLTVRRTGEIVGPHSAVLERWFGVPAARQSLASYVASADPQASVGIAMEFDALVDGFLPDELILDQMPKQVRTGELVLSLELQPLPGSADFLVILSDVTARVARERTEVIQREMAALAERALQDPRGLELLLLEATRAMARLRAGAGADTFRLVHTLKGNMSLFGVLSMSNLCHALESKLVERAPCGQALLRPDELKELEETWTALYERASLLVRRREGMLEIPEQAVQVLKERISSSAPRGELLELLDGWGLEPVERSFQRLAHHAQVLAQRLGKGALQIEIDGMLGTPRELAPFWAAAVHLVRNAVDHGLELPDDRLTAGKAPVGLLRMSARREQSTLVLQFTDDGRGIDWAAVAVSAAAQGLPCGTDQELEDALFADRVSTRTDVTELSGRGVGLAAVRRAIIDLQGEIVVNSQPGHGTSFEVRLPVALDRTAASRAA